MYDKILDFVSCSCKTFQSERIPRFGLFEYKSHLMYISMRWTKNAVSESVIGCDVIELHDPSNRSLYVRCKEMFQLALDVIDKAVISEEGSKLFVDRLEALHEKIKLAVNHIDGFEKHCMTSSL